MSVQDSNEPARGELLKKADEELRQMSALSMVDNAQFIAAGNWGSDVCLIMKLHNKSLQVILNKEQATNFMYSLSNLLQYKIDVTSRDSNNKE